jgi:methylmalonyl-CoA mutase
MKNKRLFNEFPPVSTDDWIKKIEKDLKGKPFEKLIKKTAEGFEIRPFYREKDLKDFEHLKNLPGDFPFVRGKKIKENRWLVRQDITVHDFEKANAKALDIRMKGVDSLGFVFDEHAELSEKNIEKLLENIRADVMELNFSGGEEITVVKAIDSLAKKYNRDLAQIKGSVNYDPLGSYSLQGYFKNGKSQDHHKILDLYEAGKHLPAFHLITVNAHIFHNAGGTMISELAYALSMGVEYMTFLTDNGIPPDEAASKIRFHFAVGSDYFMEIAKFRAFRHLWAKAVNAYGIENAESAQAFIHASSSLWNKTIYDPYVNMLRTTTESMSAVISGVDSLSVLPFDAIFSEPDDFSERIARNQPLILKEESYFDKVADPAAGSYYIENLTKELIEHSWNLFLETDEKGGYYECFKRGGIRERISSEAAVKDYETATRKRSLLGINQFPNFKEHLPELRDASVLFPKEDSNEIKETEPLRIYRGAMIFEQLRYKTDRYSEQKPRPKVWMFTFGNMAMRRARSQFAGNFFGVAGFEMIDNAGFKTIEEGVKAAKDAGPDIVVLCASDEDYEQMALPASRALKNDFIVVLAGYPVKLIDELKKEGLKNFIHVKSNLLEELKKYQKLLGIIK